LGLVDTFKTHQDAIRAIFYLAGIGFIALLVLIA
jgi:hypothetical protein